MWKKQPFLASLCFWRLGICYLLVLKGVGVLPDFAFSLLKVHYHHQRRAAGVNLAPARSAPVRAQWRSCADHSRRGDALLWRGLLPRRGQTAFTNGTQGHKGRGKVHLNGSILFPSGAGCWLWLFERIFFARWKVENRTRRERVGFFFSLFLIHWVRSTVLSSHYIWIFFPGAARSHFEWKTKILRTDRAVWTIPRYLPGSGFKPWEDLQLWISVSSMPMDKFANMDEKLWILEDLNMMYIRQIALSLQVKLSVSTSWCLILLHATCLDHFDQNPQR